LNATDITIIVSITIVTVGGIKIFYALSAFKMGAILKNLRFETQSKKIAGALIIGTGSYLIAKS